MPNRKESRLLHWFLFLYFLHIPLSPTLWGSPDFAPPTPSSQLSDEVVPGGATDAQFTDIQQQATSLVDTNFQLNNFFDQNFNAHGDHGELLNGALIEDWESITTTFGVSVSVLVLAYGLWRSRRRNVLEALGSGEPTAVESWLADQVDLERTDTQSNGEKAFAILHNGLILRTKDDWDNFANSQGLVGLGGLLMTLFILWRKKESLTTQSEQNSGEAVSDQNEIFESNLLNEDGSLKSQNDFLAQIRQVYLERDAQAMQEVETQYTSDHPQPERPEPSEVVQNYQTLQSQAKSRSNAFVEKTKQEFYQNFYSADIEQKVELSINAITSLKTLHQLGWDHFQHVYKYHRPSWLGSIHSDYMNVYLTTDRYLSAWRGRLGDAKYQELRIKLLDAYQGTSITQYRQEADQYTQQLRQYNKDIIAWNQELENQKQASRTWNQSVYHEALSYWNAEQKSVQARTDFGQGITSFVQGVQSVFAPKPQPTDGFVEALQSAIEVFDTDEILQLGSGLSGNPHEESLEDFVRRIGTAQDRTERIAFLQTELPKLINKVATFGTTRSQYSFEAIQHYKPDKRRVSQWQQELHQLQQIQEGYEIAEKQRQKSEFFSYDQIDYETDLDDLLVPIDLETWDDESLSTYLSGITTANKELKNLQAQIEGKQQAVLSLQASVNRASELEQHLERYIEMLPAEVVAQINDGTYTKPLYNRNVDYWYARYHQELQSIQPHIKQYKVYQQKIKDLEKDIKKLKKEHKNIITEGSTHAKSLYDAVKAESDEISQVYQEQIDFLQQYRESGGWLKNSWNAFYSSLSWSGKRSWYYEKWLASKRESEASIRQQIEDIWDKRNDALQMHQFYLEKLETEAQAEQQSIEDYNRYLDTAKIAYQEIRNRVAMKKRVQQFLGQLGQAGDQSAYFAQLTTQLQIAEDHHIEQQELQYVLDTQDPYQAEIDQLIRDMSKPNAYSKKEYFAFLKQRHPDIKNVNMHDMWKRKKYIGWNNSLDHMEQQASNYARSYIKSGLYQPGDNRVETLRHLYEKTVNYKLQLYNGWQEYYLIHPLVHEYQQAEDRKRLETLLAAQKEWQSQIADRMNSLQDSTDETFEEIAQAKSWLGQTTEERTTDDYTETIVSAESQLLSRIADGEDVQETLTSTATLERNLEGLRLVQQSAEVAQTVLSQSRIIYTEAMAREKLIATYARASDSFEARLRYNSTPAGATKIATGYDNLAKSYWGNIQRDLGIESLNAIRDGYVIQTPQTLKPLTPTDKKTQEQLAESNPANNPHWNPSVTPEYARGLDSETIQQIIRDYQETRRQQSLQRQSSDSRENDHYVELQPEDSSEKQSVAFSTTTEIDADALRDQLLNIDLDKYLEPKFGAGIDTSYIDILKQGDTFDDDVKEILTQDLLEGIYTTEERRLSFNERISIDRKWSFMDGDTLGRGQMGNPLYSDVTNLPEYRDFVLVNNLQPSGNYREDWKDRKIEDFSVLAGIGIKIQSSLKSWRSMEDSIKIGAVLYHGGRSTFYKYQQIVADKLGIDETRVNFEPVKIEIDQNGTKEEKDIIKYAEEIYNSIKK